MFFIWPTIVNSRKQNKIHTDLLSHIDQIFQSIRILEYGGSIATELLPPDLAHKNNHKKFNLVGHNKQFDPAAIQQLKTDLQTLFGDIEYINHLLKTKETLDKSKLIHIQQVDSAIFSSLYQTTQSLITDTKQHLAIQQIAINKKQKSYKTLEIILIITTLCTVFFLTWWATRQLISSSTILQDATTHSKNEKRRHQALNAILTISMRKLPLNIQLRQSLDILIELTSNKSGNATGAIFLIDHKKQDITKAVSLGLVKELPCLTSFNDFSTCLCGESYLAGEDLLQNKHHSPKCGADKKHYCTPIGPQSNPIGLLMLGFPDTNPSHEETVFLKFVTPILAGIILKSQYEQRLGKIELATLDIFQRSNQAILLIRNNEIIDWNSGATTLFKAENLHTFPATHDLKKLLPKKTSQKTKNPFHQHVQTALSEGVSQGELQLCKQDGSLFSAALTFTTIPLHGEHIIYMVIQDISAKEAEKQALIQAKNEAEKASRAKSTFLTTMSHEILTPLNAILGITALTMNLEHSPETRENLEIIKTSSQSLRALVMDILDISKIEADQFTPISIPFSIRTIAKNLQQNFQHEAQTKNIIFTVTTDQNTPDNLQGDPSRLNQILSKLVKNGFKYTPEGSIDITISCKQKSIASCCILFTIRDTGIGIGQANLETVFNDFTQVTDCSTRYSGAGLGLTISKKIVEKMGGTMWATSTPNQGSNFFVEITFPIQQPLDASIVSSPPGPLATNLTGKKILIIEDSPINLKVMRQTLRAMGAHTFEAVNGEEGVIAMNTELDAVLMDVEMPIMDGIAATEMIRKNPQYAHIPIIAITAHDISENKNRCFRAGMNDYMTKPIEPETLRQVLTKNFTRTEHKPPATIDYNRGVTKVGGDQIFFNEILHDFGELHGKEGELLSQLFSQKNFSEIGKRAHRLKGVAGTISAQDFATKATLLEKLTTHGDINPEEIDKTILQVKKCIEDILEEIK